MEDPQIQEMVMWRKPHNFLIHKHEEEIMNLCKKIKWSFLIYMEESQK